MKTNCHLSIVQLCPSKGALKIKAAIISLLVVSFLPGCTTMRDPAKQVSIHEAVVESVDALEYAYKKSKEHGGSWGLLPSEITLTYNISDQRNAANEVSIAANAGAVSSALSQLSGKFSMSETTQRGNVITMKFTRGGR